jgi:hypothetical protein
MNPTTALLSSSVVTDASGAATANVLGRLTRGRLILGRLILGRLIRGRLIRGRLIIRGIILQIILKNFRGIFFFKKNSRNFPLRNSIVLVKTRIILARNFIVLYLPRNFIIFCFVFRRAISITLSITITIAVAVTATITATTTSGIVFGDITATGISIILVYPLHGTPHATPHRFMESHRCSH